MRAEVCRARVQWKDSMAHIPRVMWIDVFQRNKEMCLAHRHGLTEKTYIKRQHVSDKSLECLCGVET